MLASQPLVNSRTAGACPRQAAAAQAGRGCQAGAQAFSSAPVLRPDSIWGSARNSRSTAGVPAQITFIWLVVESALIVSRWQAPQLSPAKRDCESLPPPPPKRRLSGVAPTTL